MMKAGADYRFQWYSVADTLLVLQIVRYSVGLLQFKIPDDDMDS